jgi:ATP-dependent phosphoenolpyruvate carboxykinase
LGDRYAGDEKNHADSDAYLLPHQRAADALFRQHGRDKDDLALFFGLSGTGKTTYGH